MAERSYDTFVKVARALYEPCDGNYELAAKLLRGANPEQVRRVWKSGGLEVTTEKQERRLSLPILITNTTKRAALAVHEPCRGNPTIAEQYISFRAHVYEKYWEESGLEIKKGKRGGRIEIKRRSPSDEYKIVREAIDRCGGGMDSAVKYLGWSDTRVTNVLTRKALYARPASRRSEDVRFGRVRSVRPLGLVPKKSLGSF